MAIMLTSAFGVMVEKYFLIVLIIAITGRGMAR